MGGLIEGRTPVCRRSSTQSGAVNRDRYDGMLAAISAALPLKVARSFLLPPIPLFPPLSHLRSCTGVCIAMLLARVNSLTQR